MVLNVFLFFPIGAAIAWLGGRPGHALVTGFLLTLTIESLQWTVVPGRFASLGDVLANTVGSLLGFWLTIRSTRWIRATGRDALRLSAATALLTAGIITASSALLIPAVPSVPLYVQWTPVFRATVAFPGLLQFAELNTRSLSGMEWLRDGWNPESLSAELTLQTTIKGPVPRTERRAVIIRVANPPIETVVLSQLGGTVLYRSQTRATSLKLRSPMVALHDVFPGTSDSAATITLRAASDRRATTLASQQGDDNAQVTVRRTAGLGWVLLSPRDFALTDSWWVVNALWLGALAFPLSFFTRRSYSGTRRATASVARWAPTALFAGALAATFGVMGLSILGPGEIIGLLAGWGAGWWTERLVAAGRLAGLSDSTVELIEE